MSVERASEPSAMPSVLRRRRGKNRLFISADEQGYET